MAAPLPLQRPRILLISILTAYFVFLSLQAKREGGERSRIERGALYLLRPLALASSWIADELHAAGTGIVDLRSAARENVRLRQELRDRELEVIRLHQQETEVARLEALMGYHNTQGINGVLARVVYSDTRGWFKSIVVDQGSNAGLGSGSAVLDAKGLVGRVVYSTAILSKVQLLIDSNASVGCLIEKNRLQGVARGDGGAGMIVQYVHRGADVTPGDRVLSAGNDGIYPPGILIGTVVSAAEGDGMFRDIRIRPSVDFTTIESILAIPPRNLPPAVRDFRP